jgi:hypothetical protein
MKYLPRCIAALFALGLIAMSAGPAPALQTPAWQHGRGQNLSGQYSGSVTDSVLGTGTAVANLAGAVGALGGYFVFTFGSANYDNPTIAGGGRRRPRRLATQRVPRRPRRCLRRLRGDDRQHGL